jgi:hypothetical protein
MATTPSSRLAKVVLPEPVRPLRRVEDYEFALDEIRMIGRALFGRPETLEGFG